MTNTSITFNDIAGALNLLGLKQSMMVEVHSAMRGFGHVEGGAGTVISALQAAVGDGGSIVMPSFRHTRYLPLNDLDAEMGITAKLKFLSEQDEPTGMGIIADTFRKSHNVVTGKGIHRLSAWGKDACLHAEKGLRHIVDCGGYGLLLGVDIYRLSAMHTVEHAMPKDIHDRFIPSEAVQAIYPTEQWYTEVWLPKNYPWYIIQERAYQKGYITDCMIENAKCMFLKLSDVLNLYHDALLSEPYDLFGLVKDENGIITEK